MLSKFRSKFTQASANKFAPIPPENIRINYLKFALNLLKQKLEKIPYLPSKLLHIHSHDNDTNTKYDKPFNVNFKASRTRQ